MHMMEGLCECSHVAENGDGGKQDGLEVDLGTRAGVWGAVGS